MFEELNNIKEFIILYGRYILEILVLYIVFKYKFRRSETDLVLSKAIIDQLVEDFKPEPLVEYIDPLFLEEPAFVGSDLIEAADYDFYSLKDKNKTEMIDVIKEYGVGTCGPPGFYGTLDIHLELEAKASQVLGTEAAILYSNSFTCINSVINCFCREHDNVFYHKNSNEAIIRALTIIKGGSVVFSDLSDLEEKMKKYYVRKKRNFIITEGLFKNTGEITDMPRLIYLKNKYKARLIMDESLSIPLLGTRGISEFFNTDISEIDVVIGSFAHVFCGNGGFVAGTRFVTDYQRLSAKSYCFSASMPGFLAKNALINISKKYTIINSTIFFENFKSKKYSIRSDKKSPMIVISKTENNDISDINDEIKHIRGIKANLLQEGIRVGVFEAPTPSLRICIKKEFTGAQIKDIAIKITNCLNQ